jgi:hypothetical protein
MKHYRLCLFSFLMLSFVVYGYGQAFTPDDHKGRDDFFRYHALSKEFHNRQKLQCKNLNSRFLVWHYADTAALDLQKVHVFSTVKGEESIRLDTVLTPADRRYMMQQFDYYRDKGNTWQTCGQYRILKLSPERKANLPYWEFSFPLYSADYTKCLVKMNYYRQESDYLISTILFTKNKHGFWKEKAVISLVSPAGK